jgi:small subunit ribosomal protein S20
MANHKSALKKIKQDNVRRARNRSAKSAMRTEIKSLLSVLESKDKAKINDSLREAFSVIDKTAKKGVIHTNTASRYKSRLSIKAKKASGE